MHFFSVLTNAPFKRVDFSAVGVDIRLIKVVW